MILKINKIIICFLIALFLFACSKANRDITERDEIEPNDSHEYAQFIDSNILIKANLDFEDIDYYKISPTNGFIMDFSIKADNYFDNIIFEILDNEAKKILFKIETKDILNYHGIIEMKDLILNENGFLFKLTSDKLEENKKIKYDISFNFKNEYDFKNERENNDNFNKANIIDYPNQIVYGYFIKNYNGDINNNIEENIKPYLKNENIIDIDFYLIENETDINSSINIILEYKKDIDMILFDKDYNYIKESKNKLYTDFKSGQKYYIALIFYGDKYLIDRYKLYYDFN
ncbi:hypothetical protein EPJ64_09000 [Brachyspira aalborgi]|jgi:hypothetical protein|uniref:DNA-binding protein n=1 Tax=Brachyspira aalborgi TaxID=29522 RepID=A0AB38PU66_9SPIR|nr:hypothetical protein [Brachyspira aalborgi]MBS4763895.1 hypothetical protein [Brachyspira sp.]CCY77217.1 putative uncharacterized protein [Brachyspira sp. CAG:700]TXJ15306.1 hypothetical protein EPJ77_09215 [Brachyspira aalborgi]TXJ18056.1 hypothetical protein EPJ64_09000 [Brachyspira aalborgi]TXJ24011.1 hypothetical protein EPJ73_09090 [Brachyspira aalborgi]